MIWLNFTYVDCPRPRESTRYSFLSQWWFTFRGGSKGRNSWPYELEIFCDICYIISLEIFNFLLCGPWVNLPPQNSWLFLDLSPFKVEPILEASSPFFMNIMKRSKFKSSNKKIQVWHIKISQTSPIVWKIRVLCCWKILYV